MTDKKPFKYELPKNNKGPAKPNENQKNNFKKPYKPETPTGKPKK